MASSCRPISSSDVSLQLAEISKCKEKNVKGFDNKLVNPGLRRPGDVCSICTYIAKQPVLVVTCGHVFCCECLMTCTRVIEESGNVVRCPTDNEGITKEDIVPDKAREREILDLRVYCKNEELGCLSTFQLRDYQAHLEVCEFNLVICPFHCGREIPSHCLPEHKNKECMKRIISCSTCQEKVMWEELDSHLKVCENNSVICPFHCGEEKPIHCLPEHKNEECMKRIISCSSCQEKVVWEELDVHIGVCQFVKIRCPYCGAKEMFREELIEHMNRECPKYPTFCGFALFGCDKKISRQQLIKHHLDCVHVHSVLLNAAMQVVYSAIGERFPLEEHKLNMKSASFFELPLYLRENLSGAGGERRHCDISDRVADKWLRDDVNNLKRENEKLRANAEKLKEQNEMKEKSIETLRANVDSLRRELEGYRSDFEIESQLRETSIKSLHSDLYWLGTEQDELRRQSVESLREDINLLKNMMQCELKPTHEKEFGEKEIKSRLRALKDEFNKQITRRMQLYMQKDVIVEVNEKSSLYICPVEWLVQLVRGMNKVGPGIGCYSVEGGYLYALHVKCDTKGAFEIACVLQKGKNDSSLEWPYPGGDKLEVRTNFTYKVISSHSTPRKEGSVRPSEAIGKPVFSILFTPPFLPFTVIVVVKKKDP